MHHRKPHTVPSQRSILVAALLLFSIIPAQSQDDSEIPGWRGALSLEAVSKYLWRGTMMHDGPSLQPGLEFTRDQWTAGLWASYNIGRGPNCTTGLSDLYPYFEYSQAVPHLEILSVDAGFTLYTYPLLYRTPGVHRYSPEASLGFTCAIPGEPSLTFYKDFFYGSFVEVGLTFAQALFMGWTMEAELVADYSRQEQQWTALVLRLTPSLDSNALCLVNLYYQAGLGSGYDNALFFGVLMTHDLF